MVQSAESVGKLVFGSERQVRQAPAIAHPFGCKDIAPQYGLATVAIGLMADTLKPADPRFPIVPMHEDAFLPGRIARLGVGTFVDVAELLKPDTHYSVRSFYVMEPVHPAARWAAVRPGARSRSGIDQIVANSRQGRIFLPAKEFRPAHSGDRHICIRNLTRSEERRVGKECFSTCISRWSTDH